MAKGIETSRIRLWERTQTVLASQLPAQITALTDAGLYLPAPDSDAYYLSVDGEGRTEQRVNHPVSVFIFGNGSRSFPSVHTGDGIVYAALGNMPFTVELHARWAPQDDHTELGKVLPHDEVEVWRAERYLGALLKTIFKHIRTTDDIYNIQLLDDSTRLDEGWTVARTDWLASQEVHIPFPDFTTV